MKPDTTQPREQADEESVADRIRALQAEIAAEPSLQIRCALEDDLNEARAALAHQAAPDAPALLLEAINRLKDMLQGDDGQAWKEARKFVERLSPVAAPEAPTLTQQLDDSWKVVIGAAAALAHLQIEDDAEREEMMTHVRRIAAAIPKTTGAAPEAPAGERQTLQSDMRADYYYLQGLRAGWNLSQQRDVAGFNAALASRQNSLDEAKAELRATPAATTASTSGDESELRVLLSVIFAAGIAKMDPAQDYERAIAYFNRRATAPSRNAAPLEEIIAAVCAKHRGVAWGSTHRQAMREVADAALTQQSAAQRCPHCDDTGDVHRADGEYMGKCSCGAAQASHAGAASCRNAIINSGAQAWPRSCLRCGIAKNCPDGVVVTRSAATEQKEKP